MDSEAGIVLPWTQTLVSHCHGLRRWHRTVMNRWHLTFKYLDIVDGIGKASGLGPVASFNALQHTS